MRIDPVMNVRSVLGLIASDFSYKKDITVGDLLETHPDNKREDDADFPAALRFVLNREPLTQFENTSRNGFSGVKLPQW